MKSSFFNNNVKWLFEGKRPFDLAHQIEGEIYRQHANRITKRFEVNENSYFIKLHGSIGWKEIIKNLVQLKKPVIGAQNELNALNHLSKNKIDSLKVAGYFFRGLNPANSQSFLITEELERTISLEEYFLRGLHTKLSFGQKKLLIEETAKTLKKMHDSGLNHRDLYLCHLHIKEDLSFQNLRIYIIDLHRAQIRKSVPQRWLIKDLGGFLHSALGFGLTERDFYRFFKTYFNCSFRELSLHNNLLKKILKRGFSMYLNPRLKPFKFNSRHKFSEESQYLVGQDDNGRWLTKKNLQVNLMMNYIKDENHLISSGQVIKNEKGHLVVRTEIDKRIYFIKKYRIKNQLHGLSRLFKKTRAYNSWLAYNWLKVVGIKSAEPAMIYICKGFLGNRNSFLITEEIEGKRFDKALLEDPPIERVVSSIAAFFKRMSWISFIHGDAKSSNFFLSEKSFIALDLDSASQKRINRDFSRDRNRILKSIKHNNFLYQKLKARI